MTFLCTLARWILEHFCKECVCTEADAPITTEVDELIEVE
jgi:hypothetical protein